MGSNPAALTKLDIPEPESYGFGMHQTKIAGLLMEAAKLLKQDVDKYGEEVYDELIVELETTRGPHARLAAEMLYGIGDSLLTTPTTPR